MKTIEEYLSEQQVRELVGLSDHEKIAIVLMYIFSVNPAARFSCSELARFLGKDPKHPRGMYPMVYAIKRKDPSFPIEMIVTNKGKQAFDKNKVDDLRARWKIPTKDIEPPLKMEQAEELTGEL